MGMRGNRDGQKLGQKFNHWMLVPTLGIMSGLLPSWAIASPPTSPSTEPQPSPGATQARLPEMPLPWQVGQVSPPLPSSPNNPPNDPDNPFLQPAPPLLISPPEQIPLIEDPAPEAPPTPVDPSTQTLEVTDIQVVGSSIFSDADLEAVVQPFEGRSLTVEELRLVADEITQLYLNQGYLTSRAVLVNQDIVGGVVEIQVIEGSLETIEIEGNRQVNTSYIRSRVALGASTPFNQFDLEDQLRLLRLNPLFENVEASLRAAEGLGQSILTVRVTEANPFYGYLGFDNYSPASVGSERMTLGLGYRNLTGIGDELSATFRRTTTGGGRQYDFGYRVPLNAMEGTLSLRVAPSDFNITDPAFEALDINGSTDFYEVSFRQPLWRSPREEFALSLGFSYRDGETLFGNFILDSSTTSVIRFGQDLVRRDVQGAWAVRSQFSLGTELFDATTVGNPNGQFFSWLGQLQRVQILNPDNLLILQADLQLTPDALLASEQLAIGGGQSLRGFRQNARLGDNGFRLSIEDRITLARDEAGASTFQLAPFADIGAVWNDGDNPQDTPDQNFLAGIGLGVLWEPAPNLSIRLDSTLPLIDLNDRGENAQDLGLYFNVNLRF